MKLDFKRLNELLEKKASRAIDRLDSLKCYTDDFQKTLDSIMYMLQVSKDLGQYDTECLDCKEKNEKQNLNENENQARSTRESQVGKPYKTFKEEDYE